MAGFSDEDIQKVRDATDIVQLFAERTPVKRKGRDVWCCCPFHQEKTPSCKIDPAMQLWHCFGCGEGGDLFSFVMKADGMSFPDAVRYLAERAHIEISESGATPQFAGEKARMRSVCMETAKFYHAQLKRNTSTEAQAARDYLANRGLGGQIPLTWNLGFAPGGGSLVHHLSSLGFSPDDMIGANVAVRTQQGILRDRFFNRIMFPINNAQGEPIAFGGRIVGSGEPKYLNSQETPLFHKSRVLYGLDKGKAAMTATGAAVVVEGYTDVIALSTAGLENVVATLGTALTMSHIRLLSRHAKNRIIYLFDGDEAGQRACDRALNFIDESMTPEAGSTRIELFAATLPENLDPAEYVEKYGIDNLKNLVNNAEPLLKYGISRRLEKHDLNTPEGRTRATADALSVLAPIKTSLLAKDYAILIASKTRAREEDVLNMLAALKPPARYGQSDEDEAFRKPAQPNAPKLPKAEINRLKLERKLICLCAQNPQFGLAYASSLAQTQWHHPTHARLAQSLLATLSENPEATPDTIVANARTASENATSILTTGLARLTQTDVDQVEFIVGELEIGDMEASVESLKYELDNSDSLSEEDRMLLFGSVASMQQAILDKRKNQKPPMF